MNFLSNASGMPSWRGLIAELKRADFVLGLEMGEFKKCFGNFRREGITRHEATRGSVSHFELQLESDVRGGGRISGGPRGANELNEMGALADNNRRNCRT